MDENQLFETAKSIFLQQGGRKQVIDYLKENGVSDEDAEAMATKVYLEVKSEIPQVTYTEDEGSGFPSWLIYVGILIVINGLSAIFDWPFWIY